MKLFHFLFLFAEKKAENFLAAWRQNIQVCTDKLDALVHRSFLKSVTLARPGMRQCMSWGQDVHNFLL